MASPQLTVSDKVLLAAYDLDRGKGDAFTAEDLVVSAWQRFPRVFGLRGHHDTSGVPLYPDSNRVFVEIMGSKPIRKRGYLLKIGKKMYKLTESGREMAARLAERTDGHTAQMSGTIGGKATMSRPTLAKLGRLLRSKAIQRAQSGEFDRITFHDACVFWGITSRSTAIELDGSFANIESIIRDAEEAIRSGASELHTGSDDLPKSTADVLSTVHKRLQERFADEIETIRRRKDQRKSYA